MSAAQLQRYVLDADVFMAAARRYYAFDLVPTFWKALVQQATRGRIVSVDRLKADIDRGKDRLTGWANADFQAWFDSTAQTDVTDAYRRVMNWAEAQHEFTTAAKAEFAGVSDGWLVAYAIAKQCVVVTNEIFDASIKRRVKIPNACQAFRVRHVDTFGMLRELRITL